MSIKPHKTSAAVAGLSAELLSANTVEQFYQMADSQLLRDTLIRWVKRLCVSHEKMRTGETHLHDLRELFYQHMTDEERLEWIRKNLPHCRNCGNRDPKCQCWNDE